MRSRGYGRASSGRARVRPATPLMDATQPLVPGARIGRDQDGRPAWFVPDPKQPGSYLKVGT